MSGTSTFAPNIDVVDVATSSPSADNNEGTELIIMAVVLAAVAGGVFGAIVCCCKRMKNVTSPEGRAAKLRRTREKERKRLEMMEEGGENEPAVTADNAAQKANADEDDDDDAISDEDDFDITKPQHQQQPGGINDRESKGSSSKRSKSSARRKQQRASSKDERSTVISGSRSKIGDDDSDVDDYQAMLDDEISARQEEERRRAERQKLQQLPNGEAHAPPAFRTPPSVCRSTFVSGLAVRRYIPPNYIPPPCDPDDDPTSASNTALYAARFADPDALNLQVWDKYTIYTPTQRETPAEERARLLKEKAALLEMKQKKMLDKSAKPLPLLPIVTHHASSPLRPLAAAKNNFLRVPALENPRMQSVNPADFLEM